MGTGAIRERVHLPLDAVLDVSGGPSNSAGRSVVPDGAHRMSTARPSPRLRRLLGGAVGTLLVVGPGVVRAGRRPLAHGRNRAWLTVAAVLVLTSLVALIAEQARTDRRRAADAAQASASSRAALLPPTPNQAARALVEAVADDDSSVCALALSPTAAGQLATATATPDCAAAIHALASRVVDPIHYRGPDNDAITDTLAPDGQTGTADVCHLSWGGSPGTRDGTTAERRPQPGPQLGRLDLARILSRGYQIIAFVPC